MHALDGLSVIVTNAATDLGRGVCAGLERAGARVTSQLDAHDVSGAQLIQRAVRAFGCLDALVTCPTLEPRLCGPAESLALDSFLGGISSNLSDTFFDFQPAAASARRVPAHAIVTPDQVAEAVCILLGEAANGVAGSTLYVDGGWLADGYWE